MSVRRGMDHRAPGRTVVNRRFESWTATAMRRRLVAFARRFVKDPHEAEDIVQEVLLRAGDGQGSLRSDARAEAWLFRICRHAAIDHVRARKVRCGVWASMPEEAADWARSPVRESASQGGRGAGEAYRRHRAPLDLAAAVPAHQRLLLELHYGHGFCQAVLSRLSGLSASALRVRLYRARRRLAHDPPDQALGGPRGTTPRDRSAAASSGRPVSADRRPQAPIRTGWRLPGDLPPFFPRRDLPSAPST
jgi:RNA polymerase sigma factor (sigma-70 family)